MIATLLALFVATAPAAPLDVERAQVALEQGDAAGAIDTLRRALREDPEDDDARRLYREALEVGGAGALGAVEAEALALHATDAARGLRISAEEALARGAPEVALPLVEGDDSVAGRVLALAALVGLERHREAAAVARSLAAAHPSRPDLLLPLFDGAGSAALNKPRAAAVKAAERLVATEVDPVALYRARRVLIRAGERAGVERAAAALARVGEPGVPPRGPWGAPMRAGTARALAMQRGPALPDGSPEEIGDLALRVTRALRDMGRVQEALGVFEAARARHDSVPLALAHAEQLLRMNRPKEALAVAEQARVLAATPPISDAGRVNLRGWRAETAAVLLLHATALAAVDRPDEGLAAAAAAALIEPSIDAWTLVGNLQAALGHHDAAFTAFVTARLLGGAVDPYIAATWAGLADPLPAADALAAHLAPQLGVEPPPKRAETATSRGPRIGAPAPEPALAAVAAALDRPSVAGRAVVIAFWASWCGPCKLELPELAQLARAHADDPIDFLAVSLDDRPRDFERFVEQVDLDGLVVRHAPALGPLWRVRALPSTWVVDRDGVVRHFHEGYGPGDGPTLTREIRATLEP